MHTRPVGHGLDRRRVESPLDQQFAGRSQRPRVDRPVSRPTRPPLLHEPKYRRPSSVIRRIPGTVRPMRAAVLRNGAVTAKTVPDPVPGPGQLLVRTLACGICASDLHFMDHPEAGEDDDSGMSTYDRDVDIV